MKRSAGEGALSGSAISSLLWMEKHHVFDGVTPSHVSSRAGVTRKLVRAWGVLSSCFLPFSILMEPARCSEQAS